MGLTKRTYTDNVTVITAQNLNDIQDAIIALEGQPAPETISDDLKQALLQLAQKVAYIDDQGQTYYQDLYDALYPPKELVSISAVFTQGQTVVYDTDSLDSLKTMLVVTGTYDDQSTETIPSTGYTLSGTLTAGTSTITVTCDGKTTTFTVQVTHQPGVYAVTNNLTGCSNSNSANSVTEGSSYSGTITASAGYMMTGATVSITMGGVDITSTAYSNGTIFIASVTGVLVISVTAVAVTLSSISAVYTQSGTVYDTDTLDSLKADLVVTAHYSDSSTQTVPSADYTLSGTLTAGISAITVAYGGKTTTFNVTVSASASLSSISAVFTQGSNIVYDTDSLDRLKSMLVVTAIYSDSSTATVPSTDYTLSGTLSTGISTITVSYGGKSTTFNVTVTSYIQYSYSYANGDLEKLNGASIWRDTYHLAISATSDTTNKRRVFPRDYGVRSYHYTTDEVNFTDTSSYYPIPVPSDATQVTVSITPASQYHAETFYVLENGEYTRTGNPGWKEGSFTHTFAAGTYEYMSINCKYNSAGSSYSVEPTDMTILFE